MKRGTASRVVIGGNTMLDLPKGLVFGTDVILGGIAGLTSDFNGLVLSNTLMLGKKISHISVITVIVRGQSPLNLPYAIADSLHYVKAFGGTEQRNIPEEYTQVNYVTNTAQTMINTGVKFDFSKNYEIELKASGVTGSWYILQARESSGSPISGISGSSTGNVIGVNFDGTYVAASQISRVFGHIYYVKGTINNGNMTLYVKDETAGTEETVTGTYTPRTGQSVDICLFGNTGGNYVAINSDVYFARIKENDTVVMDYVPARQSATAGFYDKVSGTFKTASNLVADGNTVPTPDAPMDIVSNNGVLKVRQNLWKGNYTDLGYLDETGAVIPTTGYMASDFIEIDQSKKYTFYEQIISAYTGNGMRICFYNSSKQKVGVRQGGEAKEINSYAYVAIPPAGAKYIRVSTGVNANNVTSITLVEGEYDTTTIQGVVGSIYADGLQETINVHGKNLFDKSTVSIVAPGTSRSDFIRVVPGVEYSMSARGASVIIEYDSERTELQTLYVGASTYTPAAGTAFARFNVMNTYLDTFQIERGSTATEYEPYFNGGTATAEMLLKAGNYQDVQSIIDGVVTRNVGVKVLDGSENITLSQRYDGYGFYFPISGKNTTIAQNRELCTHFDKTFSYSSYNEGLYDTTGFINASTTVNDIKQYLADQYNAGTPVIIVYPLATPTTESVTGQTLQVQEGNNILEITQASMNGLELEASYDTGVVAIIQEVQDVNLNNNVTVTIE